MVVPYGNYLAFHDAHPDSEGTIYRIDDSLTDDHIAVGTSFYLALTTTGTYGEYFQWLDESGSTRRQTGEPTTAGTRSTVAS